MSYGVALRNGVPFTLGTIAALCTNATGSAWTPLALWPDGIDSPGMWMSPRTLTSEWQDYTGTTPVSVPGTVADSANPVGLALDIRAGATVLTDPGNHMLQSTSVDRPLLSARVNLLTYTEDFLHNAVSSYITVSPAETTGPFGDNDGWKFTEAASTSGHATRSNTLYSFPAGQVLKRTGYFKQGSSGRNVQFGLTYGGDSFGGVIDLSSGALVAGSTGAGTTVDTSVTLVNGWYECTVTGTMGATITGAHPCESMTDLTTYSESAGHWYTGDGTSFVYAFGRDLRAASVASSIPPYQAILIDGSSYPSTGFPTYQKYNGVDDGMATAAFAAGTLIDGLDCMIAVRRDSAAVGVVLGLYAAGTGTYFGVSDSAGSNSANAGAPTVWVDGTQLSGGTNVLAVTINSAVTVGAWHILEFRGLDLSAWTQMQFGGYPLGYALNGTRGDILLYPSVTTSLADKFAARKWLADYYGVTLGTPGAPVNTVAPVVSGTPSSGNTLTCSQGTWTGAVSYAYQWYDNGAPIIGATSNTFALTDAQKGFVMSCMVTATNVIGSADAASNVVEVLIFPYSGSWIYTTPTTGATPAANTISHADNTVNKLLVSTTNAAGAFVDFGQLRTGDVITINSFAFIVQATPVMYGSYASISIDPTTQQPDATYTVTVTRP